MARRTRERRGSGEVGMRGVEQGGSATVPERISNLDKGTVPVGPRAEAGRQGRCGLHVRAVLVARPGGQVSGG